MVFNNTITYGGETLDQLNISVSNRPKTAKQTVGNRLVVLGVAVGAEATEKMLTINGDLRGANKETLKSNLQALDDGQRHPYSDGVNDGDYAIISGSLRFRDEGGQTAKSDFTMQLLEW